MHSQLMEFFGNYLIQAARWQKLLEQSSPDATPDVDRQKRGAGSDQQDSGRTELLVEQRAIRSATGNYPGQFCRL